jgi:hypothetical protein
VTGLVLWCPPAKFFFPRLKTEGKLSSETSCFNYQSTMDNVQKKRRLFRNIQCTFPGCLYHFDRKTKKFWQDLWPLYLVTLFSLYALLWVYQVLQLIFPQYSYPLPLIISASTDSYSLNLSDISTLKTQVFQDITLCLLVNNFWYLEWSWCLQLHGQALQEGLACLNLKMMALRSLEASVTIHPTTQRNIPEDLNLQKNSCENF